MNIFPIGVVLLSLIGVFRADEQRPLWVIYHLANNRKAVDEGIAKGANALEADLRFDKYSKPVTFTHTFPCYKNRAGEGCDGSQADCNINASAIPHLEYLRDISTPDHPDYKEDFSGFVWLDLKVEGPEDFNLRTGGQNLADVLVNNIFQSEAHRKSKLKLGLELYYEGSSAIVEAVGDRLKELPRDDIWQRLVTIGAHYNQITSYHEKIGDRIPGFWTSSGCSDCNKACGVDLDQAKLAVADRDKEVNGIDKVVRWTIDGKDHIRENLRAGIDGFITNHPEDVADILKEENFERKYRLADVDDKIRMKCL